MTLTEPYASELLRIARKVVWYDAPEETLGDLNTFLAHVDGVWIAGRRGGSAPIHTRRGVSEGIGRSATWSFQRGI